MASLSGLDTGQGMLTPQMQAFLAANVTDRQGLLAKTGCDNGLAFHFSANAFIDNVDWSDFTYDFNKCMWDPQDAHLYDLWGGDANEWLSNPLGLHQLGVFARHHVFQRLVEI